MGSSVIDTTIQAVPKKVPKKWHDMILGEDLGGQLAGTPVLEAGGLQSTATQTQSVEQVPQYENAVQVQGKSVCAGDIEVYTKSLRDEAIAHAPESETAHKLGMLVEEFPQILRRLQKEGWQAEEHMLMNRIDHLGLEAGASQKLKDLILAIPREEQGGVSSLAPTAREQSVSEQTAPESIDSVSKRPVFTRAEPEVEAGVSESGMNQGAVPVLEGGVSQIKSPESFTTLEALLEDLREFYVIQTTALNERRQDLWAKYYAYEEQMHTRGTLGKLLFAGGAQEEKEYVASRTSYDALLDSLADLKSERLQHLRGTDLIHVDLGARQVASFYVAVLDGMIQSDRKMIADAQEAPMGKENRPLRYLGVSSAFYSTLSLEEKGAFAGMVGGRDAPSSAGVPADLLAGVLKDDAGIPSGVVQESVQNTPTPVEIPQVPRMPVPQVDFDIVSEVTPVPTPSKEMFNLEHAVTPVTTQVHTMRATESPTESKPIVVVLGPGMSLARSIRSEVLSNPRILQESGVSKLTSTEQELLVNRLVMHYENAVSSDGSSALQVDPRVVATLAHEVAQGSVVASASTKVEETPVRFRSLVPPKTPVAMPVPEGGLVVVRAEQVPVSSTPRELSVHDTDFTFTDAIRALLDETEEVGLANTLSSPIVPHLADDVTDSPHRVSVGTETPLEPPVSKERSSSTMASVPASSEVRSRIQDGVLSNHVYAVESESVDESYVLRVTLPKEGAIWNVVSANVSAHPIFSKCTVHEKRLATAFVVDLLRTKRDIHRDVFREGSAEFVLTSEELRPVLEKAQVPKSMHVEPVEVREEMVVDVQLPTLDARVAGKEEHAQTVVSDEVAPLVRGEPVIPEKPLPGSNIDWASFPYVDVERDLENAPKSTGSELPTAEAATLKHQAQDFADLLARSIGREPWARPIVRVISGCFEPLRYLKVGDLYDTTPGQKYSIRSIAEPVVLSPETERLFQGMLARLESGTVPAKKARVRELIDTAQKENWELGTLVTELMQEIRLVSRS